MNKISGKVLVLGVVGVLVMVGLGYGGYNLWQKSKPQNTDNQSTHSAETQSVVITDLGDGWKRYTHKTMGFSVEYPDGWMIDDYSETDNSVTFRNLDPRDYPVVYTHYQTPDTYRFFTVGKQTRGSSGESVNEWYKKINMDNNFGVAGELYSVEELIVAGKQMKRAVQYFEEIYSVYYIPNWEYTAVYWIGGSIEKEEPYNLHPETQRMLESFAIL